VTLTLKLNKNGLDAFCHKCVVGRLDPNSEEGSSIASPISGPVTPRPPTHNYHPTAVLVRSGIY
jgi:hypothetical protein